MSPDQESRVRALERDMAGVQQRLDDLKQDVAALTPLVVGHAELRAAIAHIETEVARLGVDILALKTEIAKIEVNRQTERREDRQDKVKMRAILWAGCFTVLASVITATAAILASAP